MLDINSPSSQPLTHPAYIKLDEGKDLV
jgi:hypothetical protein